MARISTLSVLPPGSQLGMTLDRYQEMMGLDVCDFNGVNKPTVQRDEICHAIIKQSQRDRLARYLLQAEQKREEWLNYYLTPKWTTNERHTVGVNNPFILEHKHLISVGAPTTTVIEEGVVLDHGPAPPDVDNPPNDPVTLTVTTAVDIAEIRVYYPDEAVAIHTTDVVDNGDGTVTITIPRCRLVKPEYNDDRDDPLGYYINEYFLDTVDIKWVYADEPTGAEFMWLQPGCVTDCVPRCQPACPIIFGQMDRELSIVHLYPAAYNGGWSRGCWNYYPKPDIMEISYLSGKQYMTNEIYTIRLAHTLMPRSPCSCDLIHDVWEDDRNIVERTWTTYGSRFGALETWMADKDLRIAAGGMFPGIG